ncbi:hypothetical protein [Stenotrophomonas sp. S39]|uniref:hypothetical protein n=1 Tax=Stenotrophomonas sp. S39 TaxID=2767451 RepID=UPI00190910C0|nr:hypothetical protein [Stenotrophomonas sp. S39]MBK0054007.1 hypothetical protein [Stenotrophomonas sp. S39]
MPHLQDYPEDIDCTWLGVDRTGAVAAFVTAGKGEIPAVLLADAVVDILQVETMLVDLPVVGDAVMHVTLPRPDDYLAMASRGIHVYDWTGHDYRRVATPATAIQYSALRGELQVMARLATFDSVDFGQCPSLSVGDLIEAVQSRF